MNDGDSLWWSSLRQAPKLVCLARTFPKHAEELGNAIPQEPIFFLKASSAIIGDGEDIIIPSSARIVHHEAEVAVVLKHSLYRSSSSDAALAIAGYTVLNDITARDIQRMENGRFSRAKSFNTFCPMSTVLLEDLDWRSLSVGCSVNDEVRQYGALTEMSQTPTELLSWVSFQMRLSPGDVVSLGTPDGVAEVTPGDRLLTQLFIDGTSAIRLCNPVVSESKRRQNL